jgi:surface antigen
MNINPSKRGSPVRRLKKRMKKTNRAAKRNLFFIVNTLLILVVLTFVWVGHNNAINSNNKSIFKSIGDDKSTVPLDTISAADIAANVARATSLPEAVSITNQADSYNAQISSANVDETIITKPQLVGGGAKSRKDIQKYYVKAGENVPAIAIKFGVTTNSIRWSNGLANDNVAVGKELLIPPRDGIIYKIQSGDTPESLASKYQADKAQLVTFNDIEVSGMVVGETIFIPDAVQPSPGISTSGYLDSSQVYGFAPQWGGNGYSYGYCTYYAANRVSVPRNWGNANTWAYYARLSGWTVSSKPVAGAVAQHPGMSYWGHVAYVEEVSADGAMMRYSDMNGLAGWGRVGTSGWVPISTFPNYIYH